MEARLFREPYLPRQRESRGAIGNASHCHMARAGGRFVAPALDDKLQNTILVGLEGQVQLEVPEIARKGTARPLHAHSARLALNLDTRGDVEGPRRKDLLHG